MTATLGSSGSHWNQASAKSFHSSRALAGSRSTCALPETETHFPSSVNATFTSGRRRISTVFSESSKARNHSVPSGSACWQAIGRAVSLPLSSWTVVRMAVRWSLMRSWTCSAPFSWWLMVLLRVVVGRRSDPLSVVPTLRMPDAVTGFRCHRPTGPRSVSKVEADGIRGW